MKYEIIPVTAFAQNCSIIWCEVTLHAAIIDPGGDEQKIRACVERLNLDVKYILLTHGHLDHVGASEVLAEHYAVEIYGPHIEDDFWLQNLPMQSQSFGLPYCAEFEPTRWLQNDEILKLGETQLSVIHAPGHTPGHVVFYNKESEIAFVGDVLFHHGIGRTDFPQGDYQTLMDSIKLKLLTLGDNVTFIPGHGPTSTFGDERLNNPFLI